MLKLPQPAGPVGARAAKRFLVQFRLFSGPLVTFFAIEKKTKTNYGLYGILMWEGSDYTGSGESGSDRYLLGTAIRILWTHTQTFLKSGGLKSR